MYKFNENNLKNLIIMDNSETIKNYTNLITLLKETIFFDEKKYVFFNRELNRLIQGIKNLSSSIPQVFFILNYKKNLELHIYEQTIKSTLLASLLGQALNLSEKSLDLLIKAALLRDIGILRVPHDIINKSEQLKNFEMEEIKKHPLHSYAIVKDYEHMELEVCQFILTHHEREDGSGYPMGLIDKEIPLESKIIAISDCFTAMINKTEYEGAISPFEILEKFYYDSMDKLHLGIILKLMKLNSIYTLEQNVLLNNGLYGIIFEFPKDEYTRPIIKLKNGTFLNLKDNSNLSIEQILF